MRAGVWGAVAVVFAVAAAASALPFPFSLCAVPLAAGGAVLAMALRARESAARERRAGAAIAAALRDGDVAALPPSAPPALQPVVAAAAAAIAGANESQSAMRQLASDAAHQLRTPLAVLNARLTVPGAAFDPDEARRDLEWMGRLVDQILSAARSAGAPGDPDARFDAAAVAGDVVAALVPLAVFRDRDIELCAPPGGVLAYGEARFAFEAVSNLAENALAHTPAGTMVSVVVSEGGPQETTISVLDRGPGVPESERERIFERFRQGARPTAGGAGLGLSIVADIMARCGGAVRYAPRPGGGAAFTLTFRTAPDRRAGSPDAPESAAAVRSPSASAATPPPA